MTASEKLAMEQPLLHFSSLPQQKYNAKFSHKSEFLSLAKKTLFIRRAWRPKIRFAGENRTSGSGTPTTDALQNPLTIGQIRFLQSTRYVPFPMFNAAVKLCLVPARGFSAEEVKLSLSQSLMQRWHKPNRNAQCFPI